MRSILRQLIAGCGAMLLLLSFSPAAFADQSDKTIASLTKAALKLPTSPFLDRESEVLRGRRITSGSPTNGPESHR